MIVFSRSECISRDNDVTIVFALNRIAALMHIFSGNALRYVNFGCLPSAVQSLTKICRRDFEISWNLYMKVMRELKTGLYASKFATCWMFLESF